jgi:hypothetical protein
VVIPMPTQPIIILGPTTEGFGISNRRQLASEATSFSFIPSIMCATPSLQSLVTHFKLAKETYKAGKAKTTLKQLFKSILYPSIKNTVYILQATKQPHQALSISASILVIHA